MWISLLHEDGVSRTSCKKNFFAYFMAEDDGEDDGGKEVDTLFNLLGLMSLLEWRR